MNEPTLRVISLGAGVQSSVMALMASRGEFDAIPTRQSSPTLSGSRRRSTSISTGLTAASLPIPGHWRRSSRDSDVAVKNISGQSFVEIPDHVESRPEGKRTCPTAMTRPSTRYDPIRKRGPPICWTFGLPILRKFRRAWVEQWIGISTDESQRMKDSKDFDAGQPVAVDRAGYVSRRLQVMVRGALWGRNLPRSSCIGCISQRIEADRHAQTILIPGT